MPTKDVCSFVLQRGHWIDAGRPIRRSKSGRQCDEHDRDNRRSQQNRVMKLQFEKKCLSGTAEQYR